MSLTPRDIREERIRRKERAANAAAIVESIRKELFDRQLGLLDDPSRFKAALCTRRAGKTSTWSRYGVITCLLRPRALVRIWAASRLRAKELLWREINDVCSRHRIPVKTHETELRFTFENGSEIRLVGADKDKEAQKKRGDKTNLEVVLEAQSFGPFLKTLVEDVIEPCLIDYKGTVCIEGTPGVVCAGHWYDISGREDKASRWESVGNERGSGRGWSVHRWSILDNPFLPHALEELASIKKRKGWDDTNPTWQREYKALWVNDSGALFYKWSEHRNLYSLNSITPWGPEWHHVLGWDIGFNDAMAIVVWGWRDNDRTLYEAWSWSESPADWREEGITTPVSEVIATKIQECQKRFNIVKMVADTGGGGRLFVDEVQSRHGLVFDKAEKTAKYDHVVLMNDDFLTSKIKTLSQSAYTQDVAHLPVDQDWEPESGKPKTEDPKFPNHVTDAGLYAWRYASAFLEEDLPEEKSPEQQAEDQILATLERSERPQWWEPTEEYDYESDL